MIRSALLLTASALLFFSCKDDEPVVDNSSIEVTDLEIATGVVLTDENGQGIGSVGNPNWYEGLILYPNPPADVQTAGLQSSAGIVDLQILPAEKNTDFTAAEVTNAFTEFEGYPDEEVQAKAVRSVTGISATANLQYRLDGLSPGYYRVIATDESGKQHGSTIFIDSTLSYPNELRDSLFADWQ